MGCGEFRWVLDSVGVLWMVCVGGGECKQIAVGSLRQVYVCLMENKDVGEAESQHLRLKRLRSIYSELPGFSVDSKLIRP